MSIYKHLEFAKINSKTETWYSYGWKFLSNLSDPLIMWPFSIIDTRTHVLSVMTWNTFKTEADAIRRSLEWLRLNIDWSKWVSRDFIAYSLERLSWAIDLPTVTKKTPILVTPESYSEACEILWIIQWASIQDWHRAYILWLASCHPDKINSIASNLSRWILNSSTLFWWWNWDEIIEWFIKSSFNHTLCEDEHRDNIWYIFGKKRESVQKAWEIFQAFRWFNWENSKDIDLKYVRFTWESEENINYEYQGLYLDNQVSVVNWVFNRLSPFWDWLSILLQVKELFWKNPPQELIKLITLLKHDSLDKDNVQKLALSLLQYEWHNKPEWFNDIMQSIIKSPKSYSKAKELVEFEPTLLFWKWKTWPHWLYQDWHEMPLWKLFAHIYLKTAWDIPFRIWEKFLRKHIPDISPRQIENILQQISQWIDPDQILSEFIQEIDYQIDEFMKKHNYKWIVPNDIDADIRSEYEKLTDWLRKLQKLIQVINEIYYWLNIIHIDDLSWEDISRLWIELWQNWEMYFYFPIVNDIRVVNTSITFSVKDMTTMYFAMLESDCLESKPETRMIE